MILPGYFTVNNNALSACGATVALWRGLLVSRRTNFLALYTREPLGFLAKFLGLNNLLEAARPTGVGLVRRR
jgi:hypothetical protein